MDCARERSNNSTCACAKLSRDEFMLPHGRADSKNFFYPFTTLCTRYFNGFLQLGLTKEAPIVLDSDSQDSASDEPVAVLGSPLKVLKDGNYRLVWLSACC